MKTSGSTTRFHYDESFYRGKRVLVLGGLGFIGQNLVRALAALGSDARVVDLTSDSSRTLGDFPTKRRVYYADRCEKKLVDREIHTADIIFNLAGRSGVADSFRYPRESLRANCMQHLSVLQACHEHNPDAIVVFPSSCLVYRELPVTQTLGVREHEPIYPLCPYAVHKYTCEMYSRLYREVHGLSTVILRISNPIGPYQYRVDSGYGVYNQFIYLATNDRDITVYGEGTQIRDIIGVDDVVQAFLYCASAATVVDTVNVGRGVGITLRDYAQLVVDVVGRGRVTHIDWPVDSKSLPPTDFVADISRICSLTNWQPDTDLRATIATTAEFYRWAGVNSLIISGERKC